ncbi:hypothetical protein GE061_001172 [Apolygus lucorum]|uniref:Uncharacterized protein n=1 Tax=Apolygus lucorum TaxID=248454 RepID=A0A8S9Y6B2_APOLU|nr:hypothetical protein GE061_001172 [Apolygus lucorum]
MMKVLGALCVIITLCTFGVSGQQREDSYMEAYHESHYPGQYFSLDDMTFRMPMEDMQNNSIIPYIIKIAAIAAKILLKLTLFKIVVKFIAVICLFLFIPKLKFDKRSLLDGEINEGYIDSLAEMVLKSLEKHEPKKEHWPA